MLSIAVDVEGGAATRDQRRNDQGSAQEKRWDAIVSSPSWRTPVKYFSKSSRAASATVTNVNACRRNSVAVDPLAQRSA